MDSMEKRSSLRDARFHQDGWSVATWYVSFAIRRVSQSLQNITVRGFQVPKYIWPFPLTSDNTREAKYIATESYNAISPFARLSRFRPLD